MKRLKKSKRVSWASGAKLCQVKCFLFNDCPSKVTLQAQDCLQAKTWVSCLKNVHSVNHHFRFDGECSTDPLQEKQSVIAQIKWKCPPKLGLNFNWHLVAGEESQETETQKHREKRVREAVYPCVSDIPHSPCLLLESQEYHLDDSHIPIIPITPIEEEEAVDLPSDMAPPQNASFEAQSPALPQSFISVTTAPQSDPQPCANSSADEKPALEVLRGFQADVGVAVVAAITTIMKSNEQGSLIDTDLLIKVLSDPKMIEILVSEQPAPDNAKTEPVYASMPSLVAELVSKDAMLTDAGSTSTSGSNLVTPSVAASVPRHDPVINKFDNELGAAAKIGALPVTPSVAVPWLNPDPVIEKLVQKYRVPIKKGVVAPLSGSKPLSSPKPDPFIDKLIQEQIATADTADAASISRSYPTTSSVAFPSPKAVPLVKNMIHERGVPNDAGSAPFYMRKQPKTLAFFLPSLTQEDVKFKRMIDGYVILDRIGDEPISRSMPLSKVDVMSGARMNLQPKIGETGLQLKGLSPDHARPNLSTLAYLVQPSSQVKVFSPNSAPVSTFSAISAAPPIKDINYIKSLIKQHGDIHETRDFSLSQSGKFDANWHNMKQVPNLIPIELTPKFPILQKPCIYFNNPKGCRNGSNCLYQHDMHRKLQPGSGLGIRSAKRLKLGGGIIGRTYLEAFGGSSNK